MKIAYEHSHLNGKEFLIVHFPDELQEILDVISSVDGDVWKRSAEKAKNERAKRDGKPYALVHNQSAINADFKDKFRKRGWNEKRHSYYATTDESTAREILTLSANEAKRIIEAKGHTAFPRGNQTDFIKNGIGIEVQFGKYSFVAYDFFVKHMTFFISGDINVGVEIIPTSRMLKDMDSGPANYEGEIFNLYRQGRNTPAVPLWVLGIEP